MLTLTEKMLIAAILLVIITFGLTEIHEKVTDISVAKSRKEAVIAYGPETEPSTQPKESFVVPDVVAQRLRKVGYSTNFVQKIIITK